VQSSKYRNKGQRRNTKKKQRILRWAARGSYDDRHNPIGAVAFRSSPAIDLPLFHMFLVTRLNFYSRLFFQDIFYELLRDF